MKVLVRLFVFYFIFVVASYAYCNPLQPVNLQLQFETDMEQPNWSVNNDIKNFPEIYGNRGKLHGSWDRFIRKFIKRHVLSGKFGAVDLQLNVSQIQR